jgi:hypothetical protein
MITIKIAEHIKLAGIKVTLDSREEQKSTEPMVDTTSQKDE